MTRQNKGMKMFEITITQWGFAEVKLGVKFQKINVETQ